MARSVRPEAYQARRNDILDVAQRFVMATKGYDDMAIQDILDELQISKGAFYHYFESKQALLEALIERLTAEATPMVTAIVDDPDLPALQKLRSFFDRVARWKTDRKDYLMALLDVWYADENAIVREKLRHATPERYGPMLTQVIRQGVAEGVMSPAHPDLVGGMILYLFYDLGYDFARLLRQRQVDHLAAERASRLVSAYSDMLERLLGAPAGSLTLMDEQTIRAWFDPALVPTHPPPQ